MYLWEDFVRNKWHFQYFKMVFRHLKFTRQTNMIIDLEKYIKVSYIDSLFVYLFVYLESCWEAI